MPFRACRGSREGLSGRGALLAARIRLVKQLPLLHCLIAMNDKPAKPTREERLADKLRENLRRRKAQARALETPENAALPKPPPKR
jgi:hypothetical protein